MPDEGVTPAKPTAPAMPPFRTYASDVAVLTGKPLPKDVVNEPAPLPPPKEAPPAYIIPNAPTTAETKEAVLKRFDTAPTAPVPAPVTAQAPAAPVAPAVPKAPMPMMPVFRDSPIHTYKSDFTKRTTVSGLTRISMVAAQQDASGTPPPMVLPQRKKSGALLFVAGAILVVAGLGSVYAAYRFATGEPAIPEETFVPTLLFADERVELTGSGEELRQSLAATAGDSLGDLEVAVVYITYSTTTEAGVVEQIATGNALFEALRLPAPSILVRNLDPRSTLGVIRANEEARPFFVLRVTSYDRTFAGMLEWEATIERDLLLFYPPHSVNVSVPATTTASTTPTKAAPAFRLSFTDEVMENRDVRVLRDSANRIIMLYGYRDKETLIIARSQEAFAELIDRLSSSRAR